MNIKYLILMAVSCAVIALDQWTKLMIYTRFELGESVSVIYNYFNITYVRNFGAAFGFLAESHPEFRKIFFLLLPPAALVVILSILRNVDVKDRLQILALSSVFGGAIGNYIDRIRFGFVVDFLDFHYHGKIAWPAFNVADMAIVVGISVLLLLMALEKKQIAKA